MFNIALLSGDERRDIELKRYACLLKYKLRKGKITRKHVTDEINSMPEVDREKFRAYVNEANGK